MLSPTTGYETGEFASTNTLVLGARPKIVKLAPLNRRHVARARALLTDLTGTRQRLESLVRERVQGW